jgi:toxin ParE1/3/4
MAVKPHLTRAARDDLDSIWRFSARNWSVRQANAYIRTIQEAIARLSLFPQSGRLFGDWRPGIRILQSGDHLIVYRLADDRIEIVRVLHGHMDVEGLFGSDR